MIGLVEPRPRVPRLDLGMYSHQIRDYPNHCPGRLRPHRRSCP